MSSSHSCILSTLADTNSDAPSIDWWSKETTPSPKLSQYLCFARLCVVRHKDWYDEEATGLERLEKAVFWEFAEKSKKEG